jgi:hypothetical protein
MTPTKRTKPLDRGSAGAAAIPRPAAATPTGTHAPTEPPAKVDPAVQAAMEDVLPAPGYALARLVLAEQRASELGLPAATTALIESAMLRLLDLHSSDDLFASSYPVGSVVFASLEGLAPLLGTYCFLLPLERIQGSYPSDGDVTIAAPLGFQDED